MTLSALVTVSILDKNTIAHGHPAALILGSSVPAVALKDKCHDLVEVGDLADDSVRSIF